MEVLLEISTKAERGAKQLILEGIQILHVWEPDSVRALHKLLNQRLWLCVCVFVPRIRELFVAVGSLRRTSRPAVLAVSFSAVIKAYLFFDLHHWNL